MKKVTNRKKTTAKKTVAKKPAAAKKAPARKTKKSSSYYVVDSQGRKTNMKLTLTK